MNFGTGDQTSPFSQNAPLPKTFELLAQNFSTKSIDNRLRRRRRRSKVNVRIVKLKMTVPVVVLLLLLLLLLMFYRWKIN